MCRPPICELERKAPGAPPLRRPPSPRHRPPVAVPPLLKWPRRLVLRRQVRQRPLS
jgi:hypothetical protein